MTQLSLIVNAGDVEPVSGPLPCRRLPLLRVLPAPVLASVVVNGRKRSPVTLPGYRAGEKPGNHGHTYPAEVLTTGEILRLLDACGHGYSGARNRALFTLLWRTGLRIAEALALRPKDVDLERGQVTVLHGKNNKRRVVGLDEQTAAELTRWLERRAELDVNGTHPVFCVISQPMVGKPLYSSCIREALKDTAERAGIAKRVHPHGFRHTFASDLVNEGVPLHIISRLLGHSNSATTARYVDHVNPAEALAVARARSWGAAA